MSGLRLRPYPRQNAAAVAQRIWNVAAINEGGYQGVYEEILAEASDIEYRN
jgi:hypothetical protein